MSFPRSDAELYAPAGIEGWLLLFAIKFVPIEIDPLKIY